MTDVFKKHTVYSTILCGGSGTRLWPLSRQKTPKQFLKLGGDAHSLLQKTVHRVKNISSPKTTWLVTAEGQQNLSREQCPISEVSQILVEPAAKNTGPAVAIAAYQMMQENPDAIMLILSADHQIQNTAGFEKSVAKMVELAAQNYFVIVGIPPTHPATGYGYLEKGQPIQNLGNVVKSFREKPNAVTAQEFLRNGNYDWNAGMFAWKVSHFWKHFVELQPKIAEVAALYGKPGFEDAYKQCESTPIDIAFIEKTSNIACVSAEFDWNDVGSFSAILECFPCDKQGNNTAGSTVLIDTQRSLVYSEGPFVATVGVNDLCVIATPDAVLVMPTQRSQDVKKVVEHLKNQKSELLV